MSLQHKRCKDPVCPICNRKDSPMEKEETKIVDVSNGEIQHLEVKRKLVLTMKGKNIAEETHILSQGTYVLAEVKKNIFTTNGKGGFKKIGSQYFLVADKVG